MSAIKGRLKVAVVVVGVLVVGLGIYASFQPEKAEADQSWLEESAPGHKYKWKDMSSDTISGTCSYCGHSTTIHRTRVREECWNVTNTYNNW